MWLLFLIFALLVVVQISSLRRQNRILGQRLSLLEAAFKADGQRAAEQDASMAGEPSPAAGDDFVFEPAEKAGGALADPSQADRATMPAVEQVSTGSRPMEPAAAAGFWKRFDRQFMENWTGILGAVIMVTGVGFLGGYAFFRVTPFHRFLLLVAFSGLLMVLFLFLRRRPNWLKLALWLRSSAAAILLFSCLGAGGFSALQWLASPLHALLLLSFGIGVNLYLGFIGGRQTIASLHVLLSLVALAAAPQSQQILAIGTLVALYGIALTYREKWDYHLLLTISSFFLFHLHWFFRTGNDSAVAGHNLIGLSAVVSAGLLAALVHYRQVYKSRRFEALPFAVHLLNWCYFGFGLLCHAFDTPWKTAFLTAGAVAAYGLSRYARRLPIRWLYLTDTLVAKLLLVIAIISLYQWQVGYVTICALVVLAGLLFAVVAAHEQEPLLFKVGLRLAQIGSLLLIMLASLGWPLADWPQRYVNALWLTVCTLFATALHLAPGPSERRDRDRFPAMQILAGVMALTVYVQFHTLPWTTYGLLSAVPLLYLRQRNQDDAFGRALLIFLVGAHAVFWAHFGPNQALPWETKAAYAVPLLVLAVAAARWSWQAVRQQHWAWIGIYLTAGNLFILSYDLGRAFSPLIPGVVWLLFSLLALELSGLLRRRRWRWADRHLLYVGHFYVLAFLARYFLVHVQSEAYLGAVSVRLLVELLAAGVLFYWTLHKRPVADSDDPNWSWLVPLYLEVTLLFAVFVVLLELGEFWYPLCWMALAYLCLAAGRLLGDRFSRLRGYSLLFSWAAAFHVAFLSSGYVTHSALWYRQAWSVSLLTILLLLPYGYWVCSRRALAALSWPRPLRFLARLGEFVDSSASAWVFYPFFAAIAAFLYWNFDRAILTLLWVAEAFFIFAFSILLRAEHFRYAALTVIGLSLLRLVFYDLAHAGTLTRALVFLGVGIIMLLIHVLFNQFKGRVIDG